VAIAVDRFGLSLRGRTVAQAGARKARAGTRTLGLKSMSAGARRLRGLRRPADAILQVRVTPRGGKTTVATAKVKLLP